MIHDQKKKKLFSCRIIIKSIRFPCLKTHPIYSARTIMREQKFTTFFAITQNYFENKMCSPCFTLNNHLSCYKFPWYLHLFSSDYGTEKKKKKYFTVKHSKYFCHLRRKKNIYALLNISKWPSALPLENSWVRNWRRSFNFNHMHNLFNYTLIFF